MPYEFRRVATEWDGAWFCANKKCNKMHHWKEKGYVINHEPYCKECAEKKLKIRLDK